MSTPVADTKSAAEEQVPKAEEKQETSTASEDVQVKSEGEATKEPSTTAEPTAMEVDSSANETKPEAASGEEANPAEGEKSENTKDENKNRRNGATRKRYKWLLEQGYSREEAASKAKEPLKVQELEEFKSLSGAAKKRYNWLLKNGCSEKEALTLAREPMGASKRNLSANSGPPNKFSKATADPAVGGSMVMAVTVMDYPNTSFTKTQANEFKSAILKEVIAQKDSELKPHFESCTYVKGYLRVHCSDEDTRRWLQRVVSKLTVPEGMASLKIIAERNLLKGDIYTGFFPDSRKDDNAAILEFVESQNESIDISKWKILSRKEVQNKQTVELTFTLDQASAKTLQGLGYELNYKFNKIKIRKQNKSGDAPTNANNNNNMRPVGNMGPPQMRRPFNQQGPQPNLNVWGSNYGQNRGGNNNFNRFDNSRNSFGSNSGGFGWNNGGNSFGLGGGGGGGNSSSFGSGGSGGGSNNSFGGGNNPFANAIAMAANNRSGFQSNSERPFNNLIESLYDQLKIIGNSTNSSGNNTNYNTGNYSGNNFGSSRRPGSGGGNNNDNSGNNSNSNNNQWGRNTGNNPGTSSSYGDRSSNYYGNRSFFTTTRTGFF